MSKEFLALQQQGTWSLVPRPSNQHILGSKWTYRTKTNSTDSITQYKARLVAKGFDQQPDIDFHETFSPVAKLTTIRCFLTFAVYHHWPLLQLDVSNAFLHGSLNETIYMQQPRGFENTLHLDYVCLLHKAIYGLKQAPRQWNPMFTNHLKSLGFSASAADTSLLIKPTTTGNIYILLYVDDFLITGSPNSEIQALVQLLSNQFKLKILGTPSSFLGIQIQHTPTGLFLNQPQYTLQLLQFVGMLDCKAVATPLATTIHRDNISSAPFADPTLYRQLAGSLQFLTITRPDIAYAVNLACQHMHEPLQCHYLLITRILRYLKGTTFLGIPITPTSLQLNAYSDSDWAGDRLDRRSTTGFVIFLGGTLISWKAQKQKSVARSSAEAEYRALATTMVELIWLRGLLLDFNLTSLPVTTIHCDNTSAIALAHNPILHSRMKHVEIDQHFIRKHIGTGTIQVHHISTIDQLADIFSKPLSISRFKALRSKITVQSLDHHLEGGSQPT